MSEEFKVGTPVFIHKKSALSHGFGLYTCGVVVSQHDKNLVEVTNGHYKQVINSDDLLRLEEGDIVQIVPGSRFDENSRGNPSGTDGVITRCPKVLDDWKFKALLEIYVHWSEGSNNVYDPWDLIVVKPKERMAKKVKEVESVQEFKEGDVVKIKGNKSGHYFRKGTKCTVVKAVQGVGYLVKNNGGTCWAVNPHDIEKYTAIEKSNGKTTGNAKESTSVPAG